MRILIVAPSWIGDTVMAIPLIEHLSQSQPSVEIDCLSPQWTAPLVARLPQISNTIISPFGHGQLEITRRFLFGRSLRSAQYDQAFILPNTWKSALIPYFAGIPRRSGYVGEMRYGLLNDLRSLPKMQTHKQQNPSLANNNENPVSDFSINSFNNRSHQNASRNVPYFEKQKNKLMPLYMRYLRLAPLNNTHTGDQSNTDLEYHNHTKFFSQIQLRTSESEQRAVRKELRLPEKSSPIVFCPGAEYGPAKRWPINYFAKLANLLGKPDDPIWLIGGTSDQAIGESIHAASSEHTINLCGRTTLGQAIDLLASARLVLSNDSGLMHISAALMRPLIALYGSSSPIDTPPLSKNCKIITQNLVCSPCFQRTCPLGHFHCMNQIIPEQVLEAIQKIS